MIHTSSEVTLSFRISSWLDILCTSAVKRYYAKNNSSPFMPQMIFFVPKFTETKKPCDRIAPSSPVNFSLWSTLQQKCIVTCQQIRDVHQLKRVAFGYIAGARRQGVLEQHLTANRTAIALMVHMLNSCLPRPTDVNNVNVEWTVYNN